MKQINPDILAKCVQLSFILEPVLNKKDCTNRYSDLEHKPLSDFLIAAVNERDVFYKYAESVSNDNHQIFSHLLQAIAVSNEFKSDKNIIFGLLVFMFVVVKSRTESASPEKCLKNIQSVIANSSKTDVKNYLDGFRLNSVTSKGEYKKQVVNSGYESFYDNDNLFDLFSFALKNVFKDTKTTSYQVCKEFVEGFPTVAKFVSEIDERKGLLNSLTESFNSLHKSNPELSVGFLSDLIAAALFIYLSYQDPDKYVIK